jgi:hypothetical protein
LRNTCYREVWSHINGVYFCHAFWAQSVVLTFIVFTKDQ